MIVFMAYLKGFGPIEFPRYKGGVGGVRSGILKECPKEITLNQSCGVGGLF